MDQSIPVPIYFNYSSGSFSSYHKRFSPQTTVRTLQQEDHHFQQPPQIPSHVANLTTPTTTKTNKRKKRYSQNSVKINCNGHAKINFLEQSGAKHNSEIARQKGVKGCQKYHLYSLAKFALS